MSSAMLFVILRAKHLIILFASVLKSPRVSEAGHKGQESKVLMYPITNLLHKNEVPSQQTDMELGAARANQLLYDKVKFAIAKTTWANEVFGITVWFSVNLVWMGEKCGKTGWQ